MANKSHRLNILTRIGVLALPALILAPSTTVAQIPPGDASIRSRTTDTSPSGTKLSNVSARHPLDPLEPAEVQLAVAAVRKDRQLADSVRFVTVTLNEPSKDVVGHAKPGVPSSREAFLILLDNATRRGYEAVVDLGSGSVRRYDALPDGVQPPIMLDEFGECEEAVKSSPIFREAMMKRGIDDVSLIMVDALVGGPLRQRTARGPGQAARARGCWFSFRAP